MMRQRPGAGRLSWTTLLVLDDYKVLNEDLRYNDGL
jgi:hypothetical protein